MKPGDELTPLVHKVEASAVAEMAEILRDPNPIHLDPAAVAAAGLGDRVINQGPANLGYILDMLRSALPGWRIETVDSRYLANVRAGDVVIAEGRITSASDTRFECEAWLRVEGGEKAVTAAVTLSPRASG